MAESKIRSGRKHGFTVIQNPILQDAAISLKTKGLYAVMVSLPDNWDYSISGLAVKVGAGRDAIRSALEELEKAGYLVREQQSRGDHGKFSGGVDFILYDEPQISPSSGFPTTGEPSAGEPSSGNPTQQSKDQQSKDNNPPKAPRKGARSKKELNPRHLPDVFARFWAAYPRHENIVAAIRAWDKLAPDLELCRVMSTALVNQRRSEQWLKDGGQFIPQPATWINGHRWEDEPPVALQVEPPSPERRFGWGCE